MVVLLEFRKAINWQKKREGESILKFFERFATRYFRDIYIKYTFNVRVKYMFHTNKIACDYDS